MVIVSDGVVLLDPTFKSSLLMPLGPGPGDF